MTRMHNPPHPGLLLKEWMGEMSVTEFARRLNVSRLAISMIVNGRGGVSAEMALRLSEALDTSPDVWLGMQMQYDLWRAAKAKRKKIAKIPELIAPGVIKDDSVVSSA